MIKFWLSIIVLYNLLLYAKLGNSNYVELKCLVCTRVVEEMQRNISKVNSNKMINVGGFRLDNEGNYEEKSIPYIKSEVFLTELMETICDKMDDYARATFKNDGRLTVLPLVLEDGKMNPEISEVDMVQDDDLNKSLKFYCQSILEEHEEEFINAFSQLEDETGIKVCTYPTKICTDEAREEL